MPRQTCIRRTCPPSFCKSDSLTSLNPLNIPAVLESTQMTKPSILPFPRKVSTYKVLNSTSPSNHPPLCFHLPCTFTTTEHPFTFMTSTCVFPLRPHHSTVWTPLKFLFFFKVMLAALSMHIPFPLFHELGASSCCIPICYLIAFTVYF